LGVAGLRAQTLTTQILDPIVFVETSQDSILQASKPTSKQHLAAIRQLFDYLTTAGILEVNPASCVRHADRTERIPCSEYGASEFRDRLSLAICLEQ
jgi:site-specific recombinase XerD